MNIKTYQLLCTLFLNQSHHNIGLSSTTESMRLMTLNKQIKEVSFPMTRAGIDLFPFLWLVALNDQSQRSRDDNIDW